MNARLLRSLLAGLALMTGLAAGGAQAAPVLSSLTNNGVLTGPAAYTLSYAPHSIGVAFTDSYRFTLGSPWQLNEVNSYFNVGGGVQNFAVRLFSVGLNQETLLAADLTPTISGPSSVYSFDVALASAGDYRLEVTGTRVGFDYSGTLTLFAPRSQVPEPGMLALMLAALLAMGCVRSRRQAIPRA